MHKIIPYRSKSITVGFSGLLVVALAFFAIGCSPDLGDEYNDNDDSTIVECQSHSDCPMGYSCIFKHGICGIDDNAIACEDLSDCSAGYCCYMESKDSDGSGKCIPEDGSLSCNADGNGDRDNSPNTIYCKTDEDCGNSDYVCCFQMCEKKHRPCVSFYNCLPAQTCEKNVCQGEPVCEIPEDGDLEPDTESKDDSKCATNEDCKDNEVCGPGGECILRCDAPGAEECPEPQHCNPNNGHCECCENLCPSNYCCNRGNGGFWFCGHCCIPPCPVGYACQGASCVAVVCPACLDSKTCDASTCWTCQSDNDCASSADCPEGKVCGPDGECILPCYADDAPECPEPQHCNPNNGYCECCERMCAPGQCCNRADGGFWYCGQCCIPPCPSGQACQDGVCAPLVCPGCEYDGECGASTCWECIPVDGDGDNDGYKGGCLPANSACKEGIDHCCSGTCMMGTCL